MKHLYILFFLSFLLWSCSRVSTPKPYGYARLTMPDTAYIPFAESGADAVCYPYNFLISTNAVVCPRNVEGDAYWINITYPTLNATIHCSYKPVQGNLREMTNDAYEFVYKNASHATSIPEREYTHPENHVYGVLFNLEGNTASSCQFFLTDSVHHFFRAAIYCNCTPNADSLAPIYQYLQTDVIRLIETFQWRY